METSLIDGYKAYSSVDDLVETEVLMGPALSPTTFFLASSPECVYFSVGAAFTGVTMTVAAGC